MGVRIPGSKPQGDHSLMDLLLPGLQDYVEDLPILGDIVEIISGREDGDPSDIGSMINKAKNVIFGFFGFRAAIVSRVSAIEGKIATGAEFYDNFNRGENTSALGNGWVQGGNGQPLGIRDQAAMVIVGGAIANAGRQWAKSPQAASGDAFTVSMVVYPNAQPSNGAETWLFARMNSTFTQGLVVRMTSTRCYLSRVSRPSSTSNTWTVTDIASNTTKSYSKSAIVDFRGEETVLQVSVDSTIVLTATDTVHAIDAAHRENGFAVQTTTGLGGLGPSYSGALDSYALKSVVALASVVDTAGVVATAKVAPVSSAVTAGSTGAVMPVDADPVVYAATKVVADNAQAASATAVQAQVGLQQLQSAASGSAAGGQSRQFVFTGAEGAALPTTDFTSSGLSIRGSSGYVGIAAGSATDGTYPAILNYETDTDNQSVSMTLGDAGSEYAETTLLLRCNAGGTAGAYCRVWNNSIRIGYFTARWNFTAGLFTSQSLSVAAGSVVEFRAAGTNYYVLINGVQKLSFTDTANSVTLGAGQRFSGFTMYRSPPGPVFGQVFDSFRLASFAIADYALPGSGLMVPSWKVSRSSSTGVSMSVAINSSATIPASFFTLSEYANTSTVSTLGTGVITVTKTGIYWLTAGLTSSSAFSNYTYWCVYQNGARVTQGIPTGVSTPVLLTAGDTVQPGVFAEGRMVGANSGGSSQAQDATVSTLIGGPGAYFSGFLAAT